MDVARAVAAAPGVDGLFAASTDLGSFSGFRQGSTEYEGLVQRIVAAAQAENIWLGGPQAWMNRPGFSIFQGPSDTALLRMGVQASLASVPSGIAETEGAGD